MLFEHQAACPYCGQMRIISTAQENETPEALSKLAAAKCDCPEAEFQRGVRNTEIAISEVLGEGGLRRFDSVIPDDTISVIRTISRSILREEIGCVTLTVPCGDVIKLVRNGNAVKIRRTSKRQIEM